MDSPDTVRTLLRRVVAENSDRVALIDGETQYTYKDLDSLSSAYARFRLSREPFERQK